MIVYVSKIRILYVQCQTVMTKYNYFLLKHNQCTLFNPGHTIP